MRKLRVLIGLVFYKAKLPPVKVWLKNWPKGGNPDLNDRIYKPSYYEFPKRARELARKGAGDFWNALWCKNTALREILKERTATKAKDEVLLMSW